MPNRIRLLVLTAAMAAGSAVVAPTAGAGGLPPGGTFVDDDGNTHEGSIEAISAQGITRGCSTTRYCPDEPVTRGQMAAFLTRALHLPAATAPSGFTDTTGTFADDIERLRSAAITRGCASDRYCPDRAVTRAEMATFLTRALHLTPMVPDPRPLPLAGNPHGTATIPAAARAVDTSTPDVVIGTGTPGSCTSSAVVDAVAQGGMITFDCGPGAVTIEMTTTAKVVNNTGPEIVIDGGGLVTLSGMGQRRILYMNTCDPAQVWTTSHCQDQDHPRLTVQNLTLIDGNANGEGIDLGGGGGAIWVRGGRFKIVNSRFFGNECAPTGPDVAGGAVRVFSQYQDLPVYLTNSTFGGAASLANSCSNGGALGSIGVSMTFINSLLTHNTATGWGANPHPAGTPGGGNGGAIANDGNTFTLTLIDTVIEDNVAPEGGGGVFFVSNNRTGHLVITNSELRRNPSLGFETAGFPGIFYLGRGAPIVTASILE